MDIPEIRYARTADGVHIAYQVSGEGPIDFLIVSPGVAAGAELAWEFDYSASLLRWLVARGRLANFDRRGAGLSDALIGAQVPTLEARMEDIHTVMDTVGMQRAVLVSMEESAAHCFLFAATYPERTAAIIGLAATSRGKWAPDAPWQTTEEEWDEYLGTIEEGWGSNALAQEWAREVFPSKADDRAFVRAYGRLLRHAQSPGEAMATEWMSRDTDVRDILPLIQAPTLLIHFTHDRVQPIEEGRYIAGRIPGAVLIEAPGDEHLWWPGTPSQSAIDDRVNRFLASLKEQETIFDRVLATVLFTDVVGSTERAAALGDRAWGELLERHRATVRAMLGRYRGREVDTAGDGFFAMFDGPARAIRCALAIKEAVRAIGLEVRAGLHAGEIETIGDDVRGMAVHIGARVAALCGPSEVLVSQTVKDLVVGSGLTFEYAGEHELKGVPDRWHLYRVVS